MVRGPSDSACLPAALSRRVAGSGALLSGDQRNVQFGSPLGHGRIDRHAFAGRQHDRHSGLDLAHRKIDLRAVGLHHERATRRESRQPLTASRARSRIMWSSVRPISRKNSSEIAASK